MIREVTAMSHLTRVATLHVLRRDEVSGLVMVPAGMRLVFTNYCLNGRRYLACAYALSLVR